MQRKYVKSYNNNKIKVCATAGWLATETGQQQFKKKIRKTKWKWKSCDVMSAATSTVLFVNWNFLSSSRLCCLKWATFPVRRRRKVREREGGQWDPLVEQWTLARRFFNSVQFSSPRSIVPLWIAAQKRKGETHAHTQRYANTHTHSHNDCVWWYVCGVSLFSGAGSSRGSSNNNNNKKALRQTSDISNTTKKQNKKGNKFVLISLQKRKKKT